MLRKLLILFFYNQIEYICYICIVVAFTEYIQLLINCKQFVLAFSFSASYPNTSYRARDLEHNCPARSAFLFYATGKCFALKSTISCLLADTI